MVVVCTKIPGDQRMETSKESVADDQLPCTSENISNVDASLSSDVDATDLGVALEELGECSSLSDRPTTPPPPPPDGPPPPLVLREEPDDDDQLTAMCSERFAMESLLLPLSLEERERRKSEECELGNDQYQPANGADSGMNEERTGGGNEPETWAESADRLAKEETENGDDWRPASTETDSLSRSDRRASGDEQFSINVVAVQQQDVATDVADRRLQKQPQLKLRQLQQQSVCDADANDKRQQQHQQPPEDWRKGDKTPGDWLPNGQQERGGRQSSSSSTDSAPPEVSVLRAKLESVEQQLKELRTKHETSMNDYQTVLRELELCRQQNKANAVVRHQQQQQQDAQSLELARLMLEQDALYQQRTTLELQVNEYQFQLAKKQAEIDELNRQAYETGPPTSSLAAKLMQECEELRKERDNLRSQCRYMENENANLQDALHGSKTELCQIRAQFQDELDDLRRKNATLDAACRRLNDIVQDSNCLISQNEIMRHQLEDYYAERTRLLTERKSMEQDLWKIRDEYECVMKERNSILMENEQTSEEQKQLLKKFEISENENVSLRERLKNSEIQLQQLQQQQLHQQLQHQQQKFESSREDLMFNSSSTISMLMSGPVRRMLPSIPPGNIDMNHMHQMQQPYAERRSTASSESEVALITSRARDDEVDEMRRQTDSLKENLEICRQQLDDAKARRDWALNERQRIVAERDSMHAMGDKLRKERDEVVARFSIIMQENDELRRQKQLSDRELKKLRDKMEFQEKTRNATNQVSPSHSRDSAIDADMADWEIETLELNINSSQKNDELGLDLGGGREDSTYGTTAPIYVKSVVPGTKLDGILRPYDCMLQVNNIDVTTMERRSVMDILRNSTAVKMVIRRRRLIGMKPISVSLNTAKGGDVGLSLENGVYVSSIKMSSPAAKAGSLAVGDRIVSVNDESVTGKSAIQVQEMLRKCKGNGLVLEVIKSPPITSPMTPTTSLTGCLINSNGTNGRGRNRPFTGGMASPTQFASQRDESIQTLSSSADILPTNPSLSSGGSNSTLPKKQESLLDKFQEKIFGKSEKKSVVKAVAKIPIDSVSIGNITNSNGNALAEQQVLQNLDRILEDSEKEAFVNRAVANVANAEKSSGGTWPKSRAFPQVTQNGGLTVVQQSKKTARKPVFPVFQPPSSTPPIEHGSIDYVSLSSTRSPLHQTVLRVRPSNNTQRRRQHEMDRPLSYHPNVPISSYKDGSSSSTVTSFGRSAEPMGGVCGYGSECGSRQSNRRNKTVSQYEPIYDVCPNGMSAAMVKQHHPMQLAVATPVQAVSPLQPRQRNLMGLSASSSSPWSPPNYPSGGSLHQQDETGSMISQASSFGAYSAWRTHYNKKGGISNKSYHRHIGADDRSFSGNTMSQSDVREVHIEKQRSHESLGINIATSANGVFVSGVCKDSLAATHGLQVGDRLLDVCGINMRTATLKDAQAVLSSLARSDSVTLTVQYDQASFERAVSEGLYQQSNTSTPRATPSSVTGSGYAKLALSARDSTQMQQSRETLGSADLYCSFPGEPRFASIKRDASGWPFTLVGGNACGIYIDTVRDPVLNNNLRCGDQILEFDGVDFRKVTLEQALHELKNRSVNEEVSFLLQYNDTKYHRSKRGAGDSFYVRVNVDRQAENSDELSFKTGDILRVDNSLFNGVPGLWRAWAVDQEGRDRNCGIILSKHKLEEELVFRRSGSEISAGDGNSEGGASRRGTIRRSLKFMRRSSRSSNQRAASKDLRDFVDSDPLMIDEVYQRVERLDYKQKRPVIIVSALVDVLVARLLEDYPQTFAHCVPECVNPACVNMLDQGLQQNIYVDYRKREKLFEITRVAAVKELIDKGFHCIMRVSLAAVERLHRLQIYPVVVCVKFKNYKQIKELSDDHRINSKQAKEMFEQSALVETEYQQLFSSVIHGHHSNLKHICQQIAYAVEHEQKKTLWIISSENL